MILAFNKPYGVLSQFSSDGSKHATLAEFGFPSDVYPVGRLDADSEGLLLLSNEKSFTEYLLNPRNEHERTYWAQVEGIPNVLNLKELERGVEIQGYRTKSCKVQVLEPQPIIEPRVPPIRVRKTIPDCWIELKLREGKNRQVRKMTAAIGYPTLRLLRVAIGNYWLDGIPSGLWRRLSTHEIDLVSAKT